MPRTVAVSAAQYAVRVDGDRWCAGVGLFANLDCKRHSREERRVVRCCNPLTTARAEYTALMSARRTDVQTHVLDDTEHRYVHLTEHLDTFCRVLQCNVLR